VKPFCKFGLSFWDSENTSDLYENGRSKRKRSFGGDSDEDDDSKPTDPNAYDSKMANYRTKLIRAELNKRKMNSSNDDFNSSFGKSNQPTEEDIELAENTDLLDPLNKKIHNLSLKSRENWYKKILQLTEENYNLIENKYKSDDLSEKSICVQIENEIFQKAKNLIIYQANCMKKINEIKKFNKEKVSALDSYLKDKQNKQEIKNEINDENDESETKNDEKDEKSNDFKHANFTTGFTTAKSLLSKIEIKQDDIGHKNIRVKDDNESITKANIDKIKTHKVNEEKQDDKSKLNLQTISNIVVADLTPLYKERKFESKDVFKMVARRITHYLNDKKILNETNGKLIIIYNFLN
jgi:hypothetical protein